MADLGWAGNNGEVQEETGNCGEEVEEEVCSFYIGVFNSTLTYNIFYFLHETY